MSPHFRVFGLKLLEVVDVVYLEPAPATVPELPLAPALWSWQVALVDFWLAAVVPHSPQVAVDGLQHLVDLLVCLRG